MFRRCRLLSVPLLLLLAALPATAGPPSGLDPAEWRGLLDGAGLGQARPAERHGYPGPLHVLELATELELDPGQRSRTQALFDAMQAQARQLGAAIVEGERALDAAFAGGSIDATAVAALTAGIARLRGELRAVHLQAHLEQRALLSAAQIARYRALRADAAAHPHAAGH